MVDEELDATSLDDSGIPWVERFNVQSLFGRYTYDLRTPEQGPEPSRVLILYGDNGSGKTTILRLLFHTLSAARNRGHRSYLAATQFQEFSVELGNGLTVLARKEDGNLIGSYTMELRAGKSLAKVKYTADPDNRISMEGDQELAAAAFSEALSSQLDLSVYFLSDERTVQSDLIPQEEGDELLVSQGSLYTMTTRAARRLRQTRWAELRGAIDRAEDWIRRQAISASNVGTGSVNTIYADVVQRIIQSPELEHVPEGDLEALSTRVREAADRSTDFSRFGLTTPLDSERLLELIGSAPPQTYSFIDSVLRPYLDAVQARLDALQEVQDILLTFVRTMNSFYGDKEIDFDMRRGITITSDDGTQLSPESLSSGERQLLLLLCHTLYTREHPTVFIIDEPELSLNIKWQRELVDALLACTEGAAVQFILASHSIELVAQHRDRVIRLMN